MSRKKTAPSQKELALLRQILMRLDFLLVKQMLFGITNSTTEKAMKDFSKTILKIDPEMGGFGPNRYWPDEFYLNHDFFKKLDELLEEAQKVESPALRTLSWRAKELRRLFKSLASLLPAAK